VAVLFYLLMLPDSPPPFSSAGLRVIFWRWKYQLALALGLTAVVSAGIAWALPNIYSSTAIFLPASPQSSDPDRLASGQRLEVDGSSVDLDRVLTIGQSLPLAELMIRRFHLYEHYKAGQPGTDVADNYVLSEFASNLSIVHNERDAIELTFQDHDKKLAAAVANALMAAIDSATQQLTLENRRRVLEIYRQRSARLGTSYELTRQQLLTARRRYGVFGLEEQSRYLAKAIIDTEKELRLAEAGGPGNVAGLRRALRGLTQPAAAGGNVINLAGWTQGADSVALLVGRLTDLRTRYAVSQAAFEQAETTLSGRVSSLYLIQKAYPATHKSKPFRLVMVVGSVLAMLAVSVFLILLLEVYRHEQSRQPA
jgi:uncharacterized protein involved in exopolysaccharide biosynthesis